MRIHMCASPQPASAPITGNGNRFRAMAQGELLSLIFEFSATRQGTGRHFDFATPENQAP